MKIKQLLSTTAMLVALSMSGQSYATEADDTELLDLMSLDIEELMVSVPAALTKLSRYKAPASITVITADDIEYSSARNILDLIQTYVPGAMWSNYEDGPVIGVRGSIVNRNFRYLLRVNGRIMNNKGHYGAKSELEQWDMSDIQRIEIVRGPGSVTYGPGAIAGVINITTHDAKSSPGWNIASRYVSKYNSRGVSISNGYQGKDYNVFSFASVTRTSGDKSPNFVTDDYIGGPTNSDSQALDYFADYRDNPQIKLHLDVDFLNHWKFWARYTQEGSTWRGNEAKSEFAQGFLNQQGVRDRQWTTTLEYNNAQLWDDITISAMLSADSSDVERRREGAYIFDDPNHTLNKEIAFSETEIFFRGILNWQAKDWVEIAFGTEYSWDTYGAGWGEDEKDMRLGERGIIVSGPDSNAIETGNRGSADRFGAQLYVGDGWSTDTYSLFSEVNLTPKPWLTTLFSARLDKNTYSELLFSPRIALIAEVAKGHYLKLIGQKAQRMSTAGQLYALAQNNQDPDTETVKGIELIYSAMPNNRLSYSIAGFFNDTEVIAWNDSADGTSLVGNLKLYGIEPEVKYKWGFGNIGVSYSIAKQLDWELADDVPASAVSYADFSQALKGSDAVFTSIGNDLNNWPNQSLKVFSRVDLSDKITLHTDARIFWDFQGQKDGLEGLRRTIAGFPEEAGTLEDIKIVEDLDTYKFDFRLNASLTYKPKEALTLKLFAQNLLGLHRNKRYSYDYSGINNVATSRVRFVEEPRTFGIKVNYKF